MYAVAQANLAQSSLNDWDDQRSYMVGLHIATNQVVEVSYRGQSGGFFQLIADSTVTADAAYPPAPPRLPFAREPPPPAPQAWTVTVAQLFAGKANVWSVPLGRNDCEPCRQPEV